MIPFNRPALTGREPAALATVLERRHLAGDGPVTRACHTLLERETGVVRALLTHSGTAALEMLALLAELGPGDEVIMPSYTFSSTANAVVLRGATPVFVDVRPDTFNLDETLVEGAVTPRTRAIMAVHYAGVGCAMDELQQIATRHGLWLLEDAAQGVHARYRGRALGSIGDLGALSFHETKNVISGEGGALLVNRHDLAKRAEIIREKGTDRSAFLRGEVDKYTWVDVGSSYLPSELIAAVLHPQLEAMGAVTEQRLALWHRYHAALAPAEADGLLRRPVVPPECEHNAHLYYIVLPSAEARLQLMEVLRAQGIRTASHYVPLHSSVAGRRFGRVGSAMTNTDVAGDRLLRLPLYPDLADDLDRVLDVVTASLRS